MPIAGLLPPKLGGTGATLKITAPISALLLGACCRCCPACRSAFGWLMAAAFLFGVFNILVDVPMNAHASVVERRWGTRDHVVVPCRLERRRPRRLGARRPPDRCAAPPSLLQLGIEAAIGLVIMLWATRRIGVGDTHAAEKSFVLPEGKLIALGIIALLAVFSEASVTDWSALYLNRELGWTAGRRGVGLFGLCRHDVRRPRARRRRGAPPRPLADHL